MFLCQSMVRVSLEGRPRLRSREQFTSTTPQQSALYFLLSKIYVNFLIQIAGIAISLYIMHFYAILKSWNKSQIIVLINTSLMISRFSIYVHIKTFLQTPKKWQYQRYFVVLKRMKKIFSCARQSLIFQKL